MATKAVIVLCVQTLLMQSAMTQCIGAIEPVYTPAALGYDRPAGCIPFIPAVPAGSFVVTSSSPIVPTGVSIMSQNVCEGSPDGGGNLPMLGSVGVEGEFSTAGEGAVSYGCRDDGVNIVAESPVVTDIVAPVIATPITITPGYVAYAPFFNGYGVPCGIDYGYQGVSYGYAVDCNSCGCGN